MSRRLTSSEPERLRAIEQRKHAARASRRTDLPGWEQVADGIREVREREDLGSRGHRVAERIDVVLGAGVGFFCSTTLTVNPNRFAFSIHAWLLLGWLSLKMHHLVARLEVQSVRHEVVRFAGVPRDDDLFRRDT